MSENRIIPRYFAAANTYNGFKSYFDDVFRSRDYERIFVLKGGPGTGKSSFMRRASALGYEKGCRVEEIYCSSDPNSLDGVIIESNGKMIAILDGTAPHQRDAKIPGAIDELINLGEAWDSTWLSVSREKILELSDEKSSAYKTAYSYLSVAGMASNIISSAYKSNFNKTRAKIAAEELFDKICTNESKISTRLISSFGRYGEARLDTLSHIASKRISIGGDDISSSLFLSLCSRLLREKNIAFTHFPGALDHGVTDAVFIPECDLVVDRGVDGEINADDFVNISELDYECIKRARQLHRDALEEAQRWFGIASDLHFRLEEIYGRAMDFRIIDGIFDQTMQEIFNILEKNT